ncbi:MAG TPA: magnesium transporter [Actinomycetota bacterium]|nr:magnesium transporter [Actinomycetota bacterium]
MRGGLRRILAYWRAERRTLGQGFVALVVASIGSLAGGVVLGSITGTLERLPGLLVLVPAAVAMRGNIFGAMASRLGTTIHSGLFEISRRREGPLMQNLYAATVLTLTVSVVVAVFAKAVSLAFGDDSMSLLDFIVLSLVGGVLASLFVGALSVGLSLLAYRRGWDLDTVAAPLLTAAGDMLTIPALFVATSLAEIRFVTPTLAVVSLIVAVWATIAGLRTNLAVTRRILRESLPVLFFAGLVDILAGQFVEARLEQFAAFPALLMLIPPVLGNAGGLGGMLSSRLASKLHLGVMPPQGLPASLAVIDFFTVFLIALAVFPLMGYAGALLAPVFGLESPGIVNMIEVATLAGVMATLLATVVAYYSAVATYRLGWDPDNHGIPMITSSMDFVGVVCFVIALVAVGIV